MKYLLTLIIFLITAFSYAQMNDLELASRLIGRSTDSIEVILNRTGYDYTITQFPEPKQSKQQICIYIDSQYGGIKLWQLEVLGSYKYRGDSKGRGESPILSVKVIYQHDNFGDLKDFKSYDLPKETSRIKYDKSMGMYQSHLLVTYD